MRRFLPLLLTIAAFLSITAIASTGGGYVAMLKEKVPAYERHTTGSFAPIWEPMARQMVEDYDLSSGVALDIGSSCSPFLIELIQRTEMTGYAVDIDSWAMRLLGRMVDEAGLTGQVIPVEGDWQDLPFNGSSPRRAGCCGHVTPCFQRVTRREGGLVHLQG